MEINVSQDAITSLVDKLSEKVFTKENGDIRDGPFKVHFNKKISRRLREIAFHGLLSKLDAGSGFEEDQKFNAKERLSIVGYKLKAHGLAGKAHHLEKLVSTLDFSPRRSSVYTGNLNVVHEVEAVIKIMLSLSNEAEMLVCDPCEVWRKVSPSHQITLQGQTSLSLDYGIGDYKINIDYEYYPSQIFEVSPTFGIPKRGFENDCDPLLFNIFNQDPGSCGLTKWFGARTNDSFSERTRGTLYSALIHSKTSDLEVKLELPELSSHYDLRLKPIKTSMVTEDEGFEDASDGLSSASSIISDDSGIHGLEIWDKALKLKPSRFYTWEGRKQIISKGCKPYLTEAGPEIINHLCDMRINEAAFLINTQPEQLRYLEMREFIRDSLMVLIGVPSQTFQLEKSTGSFNVSTTVRLSGCSPDSLQKSLTELAEIGTNYFRLNKFTTCQRHSTLIRSSVMRAFVTGLKTCLQKYRQSVITVQASCVQSVLDLSNKFRTEAYELKFLSDICMCSQGFAAEYGKPKPKFPVGAKLLSYLYELCLRNMNSTVVKILLYLLRVTCTPYLRFIQQWVFKGKCVDLYKEFMIFENDVYLAYRDKHYWTSGYIMSGTDKMEGVPIFLKELAKDMFVCGKSINLLKLCCPEHYICSHNIEIPRMAVVYSLSSLQRISDSSREYEDKIKKLQEAIQLESRRKRNEELHKQEELVTSERQKATRALAHMEELVEKAKKALAEKKKEELDFLRQQMEDAINRKELESRQNAEEDARLVREASQYEVTTAKVDDEIAERARQELIHYYEELNREAEVREKRAVWLASRLALKNERDTFLEQEKSELEQMREEVAKNLDKTRHVQEVRTTRKKWATNNEVIEVRNELPVKDSSQSTVQDLIYNSETAVDTQSTKTLPRIGQAMQSTAQDIMYSNMSAAGDRRIRMSGDTMHSAGKVTRATDSTIQNLMYPTSSEGTVIGMDVTSHDGDSASQLPTGTDNHGGKLSTRAMDSTVQDLLYHSSQQDKVIQRGGDKTEARGMPSTAQELIYHSTEERTADLPTTSFSGSEGGRTITRAMDSTAQNLMYHSSEEQLVPHQSTRGVGSAFKSTIQKHMYGDVHDDGDISSNSFNKEKGVVHAQSVNEELQATTSRGSEQPSVMKDILYPGTEDNQTDVVSGRFVSTRGSAPPSTIQNLMYRTSSVSEEPELPKRQQLTHEDVWLAAQFESLPDNFDIMDDEPYGDIFARVISDQPGILNINEFDHERPDDENDACDVLCLPIILQRCVMEPLTTQIKVVNSAVVSYFMENLKLVDHFETLKKFLFMEDGEFSFSLTQQLFEKISSGVTPQQLCCISTLNSIMAQSIQSSVYACQSENSRSLSFVLKSIPDIFKRNDVKVLDFIELRYKIQWPVNIVITENCITKYNRIFAFMLQLKRTAWILQDIRYSLKRIDKFAGKSLHLRKVHLFRHEMSHFVNDVQGYISNQILHVSWQEFLNALEHNVRNLDDLHDCHADYLNKSLFRALLNKKAAPVLKIITDLFTKVLKFHTQLVSSSWTVDPSSGLVVHPGFSLLQTTYESFKDSTCFLLTVITKLVNRGYQPHLEELLLRLNFNSYYDKNISSPKSPTFEA